VIKMTELDWTTARAYTSDERTAIQDAIRKNTQERIQATKNMKELTTLRLQLLQEGENYLKQEKKVEAQVKVMPEYNALLIAEKKAGYAVAAIKVKLPQEADYYNGREMAKGWVITHKGDLSLTDNEIEAIADRYNETFVKYDHEMRGKALDEAARVLENAHYAVQDFMNERRLVWHQLGTDFMKIKEIRSEWNRGWIGNVVSSQMAHFRSEAQDKRYEKQDKAGIIDANRERDGKVNALFELAKTEGVEDSKKRWGDADD
jgi:vacuolar-type H+-ATPase subunit E/Vma4